METDKVIFLDHQKLCKEEVERLAGIQSLILWQVELEIAWLEALPSLELLDLRSQKRWQLDALERLPRLRGLRVAHIRGKLDLSPIGRLQTLQTIHLHGLGQTEALPNLGRCEKVVDVSVTAGRHLASLEPILAAPNLRSLVIDARYPWDFETLDLIARHPKIVELGTYEGGNQKFYEKEESLGLKRRPPKHFGEYDAL